MDVLYLLIPLSVLIVFGVIGVFWWALQSGQFDSVEREGERILHDELSVPATARAPVAVDADQIRVPGGADYPPQFEK